ncbi:GNAT family N-acetyltransferase [Paenibacillus mesophilus]|uniref:GNAT family N-acetyltransferase n=1 Tax=Paenibacillus mesophilus TaxID=2582849 RepID=UPI00110E9B3B|nr:GNAT family protein [Paenibacillus mesophilus]TMV45150.1 GNAT family N-acetyltransferase [Paenibacillus mesophilus]
MLNKRFELLHGSAVRLVPLKQEHAEALYETARGQSVWSYIPVRLESPEHMQSIVSDAVAAAELGAEMPYTIMDNRDNRVLGSTRLFDLSDDHRSVEIGWTWLTPSVWRTRVNTECKLLLLTHAFESMGAIRVQLKTDSRNVRSREAIERIGGVFEGVLRSHRIMPDGYLRDSVYYSILEKEWPDVKRRLETMLAARTEDSMP